MNLKDRLDTLKAKLGFTPPNQEFKIDDATGETMLFPDANDFTEIVVGTPVTASEGEHYCTVGESVYKIEVEGGLVKSIDLEDAATPEPSPETPAPSQNVDILEVLEITAVLMQEIEDLKTAVKEKNSELETVKTSMAEMKSNLKHSKEPIQIPLNNRYVVED
jgi:hypothetical protein